MDPTVAAARARLAAVASEVRLANPDATPSAPNNDGAFEPLVSIVIPVFNDDRFVAAAIDSVRQQTYQGWECLVVDDGSGDTSWDVIQTVTRDDSRFRAIRSRKNRGPAAARNRAIAESRGQYLAFLDGDDLMLRYSLEDRVAALAGRLPDLYVVGSYSGARFGAEESEMGDYPWREPFSLRPFVDFVIADGECPFSIIAPLVAAEAVRAVGCFDETMLSGAADWELWNRILRNGHVFVPSPFLGAIYRQNGAGFTRSNPADHTAVSAGLIRSAHEAADPTILRDPTPFPMLQPLAWYRFLLKVAERATRFAAMALVDGKPDAMRATLSVLEPGTQPLLDRHLVVDDLVKSGAGRALGILPSQLDTETDALRPFVREITAAIGDASS